MMVMKEDKVAFMVEWYRDCHNSSLWNRFEWREGTTIIWVAPTKFIISGTRERVDRALKDLQSGKVISVVKLEEGDG